MANAQAQEDCDEASEVDASELNLQMRDRQEKIDKLSAEEQEPLSVALERALNNPGVQDAREQCRLELPQR